MKRHQWLVGLFLASSFGLTAAQVYKWVDENGVVHFSDKPPEHQQSSEVDMPIAETPGEEAEADVSAQAWLEQQRAEREAEKQQRKEQQRITEADSSQQCRIARRMLGLLEIQCPAFYDGQGILRVHCPNQPVVAYEGERRYIEDADRAASIAHYKEQLKECDK